MAPRKKQPTLSFTGLPNSDAEKDEFRKLEQYWYDQLAKDGFDDIECGKAGMQDTPYLKNHSLIMVKSYDPVTDEHYRRCRIHLEHAKFAAERFKRLFAWYVEGKSYRAIRKLYNADYRPRSLFWIFDTIGKLKADVDEMRLWEHIGEDELDSEQAEILYALVNKPIG